MKRSQSRSWTDDFQKLIDDWDGKHVVTSNDFDGFLSAALICAYKGSKLAGFYTNSTLILCDDISPQEARNALWVDLDVLGNVRCIGNHLLRASPSDQLPRRHPLSFNPNEWAGVTLQSSFGGPRANCDKYPFSTSVLIWHALCNHFSKPNEFLLLSLLHADSSYVNLDKYKNNCRWWLDSFFSTGDIVRCFQQHFNYPNTNLIVNLSRVRAERFGFQSSYAKAGYQRFHYNDKQMRSVSYDCDWIAAMLKVVRLIASRSDLTLLDEQLPTRVSRLIRGVDNKVHFDSKTNNHLQPLHVFSHAFIFKRTLKFTSNFLFEHNSTSGKMRPPVGVHIRSSDYDVYCGGWQIRTYGDKTYCVPAAAKIWNNPFPNVELYEQLCRDSPYILSELKSLSGKRLGCWCDTTHANSCTVPFLVDFFYETFVGNDKQVS